MSWRDQLRPASFRGVPFEVDGQDAASARRVALHEYPQRDGGWAEDLGRKPDAFTIDALLVGPEYMAARDALLEALGRAGPGTLLLPWGGGPREVTVRSWRTRESWREGGLCRISIEAVEAGENRLPSAAFDTAAGTRTRSDEAMAALRAAFADRFAVSAKPAFVATAAEALVADAAGTVETAGREAVPSSADLPGLVRSATGLVSSAGSLVRSPEQLAVRIGDLIGGMVGLAGLGTAARLAALALAGWGSGLAAVPGGTASRARQAANQAAFGALVQRTALVEATRATADETFDSRDGAAAVRDDLADRLDTEIFAAGDTGSILGADDTVAAALADLRAAMARDVSARGVTLPALVRFTPPATLPALVVAQRRWGDDPAALLARTDGLIARNRVRHPGFVPGGVELEALADG